ncbi:hypothetical protein BC830DRAFT_1174614 [Chytriomyces sp. MP71]|nr:hypothetical protein BC830DRAFT_1174614 [Chytriomyces sp. MP71]
MESPAQPLEALYRLSCIIPDIMAVQGVFIATFITVYIALYDRPDKAAVKACDRRNDRLRNLLAPTNKLILGQKWSAVGYYISMGVFNSSRGSNVTAFLFAQIMFVNFSWIRSVHLLQSMYSKNVFRCFRFLTSIFPVVCILTMAALILLMTVFHHDLTLQWKVWSPLAASCFLTSLTLTLDIFFGYSFLTQIRKLESDMGMDGGDQLAIICKYGCYASASGLASFAFLAFAALCLLLDPFGLDQTLKSVYLVCWSFKDVAVCGIGWSMVAMKVSLIQLRHDKKTGLRPNSFLANTERESRQNPKHILGTPSERQVTVTVSVARSLSLAAFSSSALSLSRNMGSNNSINTGTTNSVANSQGNLAHPSFAPAYSTVTRVSALHEPRRIAVSMESINVVPSPIIAKRPGNSANQASQS